MKIISGGQTGVDRAALDAALELDFPCGGCCPAGRKAEDGVIPEKYPLQCLPSANYKNRTRQNLLDADVTLIFFNKQVKGGTRLTVDTCGKHHKPFITINADATTQPQAVELILEFISRNSVGIINVAGPRKSQWLEGYDYAYQVMHAVLTKLRVEAEDSP